MTVRDRASFFLQVSFDSNRSWNHLFDTAQYGRWKTTIGKHYRCRTTMSGRFALAAVSSSASAPALVKYYARREPEEPPSTAEPGW